MALEQMVSGFYPIQFTTNGYYEPTSTTGGMNVWGTSVYVYNDSDEIVWISNQSSGHHRDMMLALNPGEGLTMPLTGKTAGAGDWIGGATVTSKTTLSVRVYGVRFVED